MGESLQGGFLGGVLCACDRGGSLWAGAVPCAVPVQVPALTLSLCGVLIAGLCCRGFVQHTPAQLLPRVCRSVSHLPGIPLCRGQLPTHEHQAAVIAQGNEGPPGSQSYRLAC